MQIILPKLHRIHILLSNTWKVSRINHTLEHEVNLYKIKKKNEITNFIVDDHSAIKLKTGRKKNTSKYTNSWILKNSLQNDECLKEEIKKKIKISLKLNENENITQQRP